MTPLHERLFDSSFSHQANPHSLTFNSVLVFPHVFLCKEIVKVIKDHTGVEPIVVNDYEGLAVVIETLFYQKKTMNLVVLDMAMNLNYIKDLKNFEVSHSLNSTFLLGVYDKYIKSPSEISAKYKLDHIVSKSECEKALESIIKSLHINQRL